MRLNAPDGLFVDVWRHLRRSMKIERHALHNDPTSRDYVVSSRRYIVDRMDIT